MTTKNILKILAIGIIVFNISSCDKLNLTNASMKAEIDKQAWNSITRVCLLDDNSITLTGIDQTGKTIILTIRGSEPGKYELNPYSLDFNTEAVYKTSDYSSLADAYIAYSGEINLSKVDDELRVISGDFEFNLLNTAGDTVKIRNGEFEDVKYN